jgi:hypothetical protein
VALICSRNPIRIGLFVSSVASLVELQSTGPFCLCFICYSCCNLAKAVANLKESELVDELSQIGLDGNRSFGRSST